ncbi:hypothetical protein VTI74DRAFT_7530 [Chaetomium olivicolor]
MPASANPGPRSVQTSFESLVREHLQHLEAFWPSQCYVLIGMVDVLKLTYATLEQINTLKNNDSEKPTRASCYLARTRPPSLDHYHFTTLNPMTKRDSNPSIYPLCHYVQTKRKTKSKRNRETLFRKRRPNAARCFEHNMQDAALSNEPSPQPQQAKTSALAGPTRKVPAILSSHPPFPSKTLIFSTLPPARISPTLNPVSHHAPPVPQSPPSVLVNT